MIVGHFAIRSPQRWQSWNNPRIGDSRFFKNPWVVLFARFSVLLTSEERNYSLANNGFEADLVPRV